jgi:hypothetical protein
LPGFLRHHHRTDNRKSSRVGHVVVLSSTI